ncbi:hypothetical protein KGQ19_39355 [Catenulispora sp. NL8]|uniref:Uncharacterized protein n=1 Tax=Catenulispora pinistramenti TaxID=2705254 RepID=A0ABS5L3K2_9ACTN|nr:hypothetical protein [Catenulispora pinistramenti]MBS2552928.1 hypothetical protein [Catenulispora pinistramenti]
MSAMAGVPWANYLPARCDTCKPGPDGAWTGAAWTIIIIGACVVLIGFGVLVAASRSDPGSLPDPGSPSAAGEPAPVMDQAQREDVERRAGTEDSERESPRASKEKAGWQIVVVGLVPALFGLIMLGFTSSRISQDKGQLMVAASDLVSRAVNGPADCRQEAALESGMSLPSALASSPYLPNAANCDSSPREYAQDQAGSDDPGVYLISVEFIYSPSFSTNGEVTIYDKDNHRSVCVTVPDTDVAAAEQASATPDSTALPSDPVSIDPSPYISDGACRDAPVSS